MNVRHRVNSYILDLKEDKPGKVYMQNLAYAHTHTVTTYLHIRTVRTHAQTCTLLYVHALPTTILNAVLSMCVHSGIGYAESTVHAAQSGQ